MKINMQNDPQQIVINFGKIVNGKFDIEEQYVVDNIRHPEIQEMSKSKYAFIDIDNSNGILDIDIIKTNRVKPEIKKITHK